MGRGRDFRGGGSGRGRHAHDEDQSVFLEPAAHYPPKPTAHRTFPNDVTPIEAIVKWFNPEKGFGFVEIADGSGDAFLSVKALQAFGSATVTPGVKLSVFVGQGEKGRQVTKIAAIEDNGNLSMPANGSASASQSRRTEANLSDANKVLGKVKWFSVEKGMGFVEAEDCGKDVFVHISVVKKAQMTGLSEGQRILMRVTDTPKGRQAVSIAVAD
jgi:CspA family cold shock protein